MTILQERPHTALLVIDVQNDVVADAFERDSVIRNINTLVDKARLAPNTPIIWVQHSDGFLKKDTKAWEIVPELEPRLSSPNERLIAKLYPDSFESTDLERTLADFAVGHLVVSGAQTDCCVRATIHGGFTRGYDVTLVGDAHTTDQSDPDLPVKQVIAHTNMYWDNSRAPGRKAATLPTAKIEFPTST